MGENRHILQIRLSDEEYEFLKRCARVTGKSLAQTMLHLADFKNRMREEDKPPASSVTIKGVPFTDKPFDDYEF